MRAFSTPTFGARIFKGIEVQEVCHYGDTCMADVTVQLATILISKQAVRQAQHALVPWWRARKARRETSWDEDWMKPMKPGKVIPQWELDEMLPPWKKGVFEEYDNMVVQFGFITLFVPAFPLAPLLALISNLVEVRSDATKLLKRVQRPVARRAQNIGKWQQILEVVSWVAVPTNAWMIAFQSTVADRWLATLLEPDPSPIAGIPHLVVRLAFVLFFQNAVMILKFILMQMISDKPELVTMAIDRQHYITALLKGEIDPSADLAAL